MNRPVVGFEPRFPSVYDRETVHLHAYVSGGAMYDVIARSTGYVVYQGSHQIADGSGIATPMTNAQRGIQAIRNLGIHVLFELPMDPPWPNPAIDQAMRDAEDRADRALAALAMILRANGNLTRRDAILAQEILAA